MQETLKKYLKNYILLRLVHRISEQIKVLKDSNQIRVASLANFLVLLKLPEGFKQRFTKFAITANLKVQNFESASKLEHSITGINHSEYKESCVSCSTSLQFGLATPACKNCKKKVNVCFGCLMPSPTLTSCSVCVAQMCEACREILCLYCNTK